MNLPPISKYPSRRSPSPLPLPSPTHPLPLYLTPIPPILSEGYLIRIPSNQSSDQWDSSLCGEKHAECEERLCEDYFLENLQRMCWWGQELFNFYWTLRSCNPFPQSSQPGPHRIRWCVRHHWTLRSWDPPPQSFQPGLHRTRWCEFSFILPSDGRPGWSVWRRYLQICRLKWWNFKLWPHRCTLVPSLSISAQKTNDAMMNFFDQKLKTKYNSSGYKTWGWPECLVIESRLYQNYVRHQYVGMKKGMKKQWGGGDSHGWMVWWWLSISISGWGRVWKNNGVVVTGMAG